jgi:hypothetical protein
MSIKDSTDDPIEKVFTLRALVGALGERTTPPWWRTQFLTPTGLSWLRRIFPRTAIHAGVASVAMVAKADHDSRTGGRGRYHLFKLPSVLEERLQAVCKDPALTADILVMLQGSEVSLLGQLRSLASNDIDKSAHGPVLLGPVERILDAKSLARIAASYLSSFSGGPRVYPYFEGAR